MPDPGGLNRVALITHHWLWQAVDWLFPPVCISCKSPGERWCQECQNSIERVGDRICLKCGKRYYNGKVCRECQVHKPVYDALRSYGLYRDPLRQAILRIKYQRDLGLGEILAGMLLRLFKENQWDPQVVIPVPLSQSKQDERGYNQVDLFARPLAWSLGLPYYSKALQRIREETSQVKLTAGKRRLNVMQAFKMDEYISVSGKRILLIDDVATTCSTVEACSTALLQGGADKVYVLTLARSLLRKSDWEVI